MSQRTIIVKRGGQVPLASLRAVGSTTASPTRQTAFGTRHPDLGLQRAVAETRQALGLQSDARESRLDVER